MGFEDFEPIIGEPKPEWWKNSVSGSPPPRRFMMHVYAPDYYHLKIQVTDFHSNTFETVKSVVQLEDLRDSMGIGGSWSDFVDYLIASVKSDNVELVLEKYSDSDDAANAKFFAQKSKGMPLIHISLAKLQNPAASDAMSEISFGLFKAYKSMQSPVTQEKEHSLQLTTLVSAEKEKSENIQSQLEKRHKSSDKQDVSASLAGNGLQGSLDGGEKRQSWTPEDDRMLVKAWSTISTDSIVGNGQNEKAFWKRICDYFNKHKKSGPERTRIAVKQHWFWLLPQVNEFGQLYNRLLGEHRSDWSDDQIKQYARELYYQNRRKHFTHEHVWVMMKDDPKWQPVIPMSSSSKRTKNNESGAYTSSSNADASVRVEAVEVVVHPIGQKTTNEKGKSKSKGKTKDSGKNTVHVWDEKWNEWKEKVKAKIQIGERIEKLAEFEILLRDTSTMTPEQRETHKKICDVIKQKHDMN